MICGINSAAVMQRMAAVTRNSQMILNYLSIGLSMLYKPVPCCVSRPRDAAASR